MTERAQSERVGLVLVAAAALLASGALVFPGPSSADVTAVRGSAFGYSVPNLTIFGGAQTPVPPTPSVTLAPDASNTPQTANAATGSIRFGPAQLFSSGPITVSTQGSLGAGGSVTSSSDIQNINTSGQEVFTASRLQSTCTASETGVTGSTTVTGGRLQTSEGNPDVSGDEVFVDIPTNPPPNYTVQGTIETVGDTFAFVFNEQVMNPDGSLTVTALHERLLGPTAVGDVYLGQVTCGVTATVVTTTTTTAPPATTTTAPPATTTTTAPTTTTTTAPPGTTTTTAPTTTTTTAPPATTTTAPTTTTTAPPATTTTTAPPATTTTAPTTTVPTATTTTTAPATATTTVPGAPTTVPTTTAIGPTVQANPSVVEAGQQTTVSGSGFPPNTPVEVVLFSDPVRLATTTTDVAGRFQVVVTIPADTTPGAHQIVVRGGGLQATATITVVSRPTPPNVLARTGSDADVAFHVAAALVAAGVVLWLLGARRPAAARRPGH